MKTCRFRAWIAREKLKLDEKTQDADDMQTISVLSMRYVNRGNILTEGNALWTGVSLQSKAFFYRNTGNHNNAGSRKLSSFFNIAYWTNIVSNIADHIADFEGERKNCWSQYTILSSNFFSLSFKICNLVCYIVCFNVRSKTSFFL